MLSRTIGLLRKLGLVLPTAQLRAVAMGLWQSRLLFGLALVGGQWLPEPYLPRQLNHLTTTKGEMELLQRLQNQMMRVLQGTIDWTTPTASLLEQNQLLSVSQLTAVAIASAGNKAVKTGKPAWLSKQLVPCQSTRTGKHNMVVPRVRTNLRQESLAVKAIKAYNHLSPEIKILESLIFKKEVKKRCKHAIPLNSP